MIWIWIGIGMAVFAVGLWGVLRGCVWFIRGRGKAALVTLAGMVMCFVGAGILAETTPKEAKPAVAETPSASSPTTTPPVAAPRPSVLPGLQPVDIYLNLEKDPYNLVFGSWSSGATRSQKCGKRQQGQADLEVCIASSNVSDVISVSATVYGPVITPATWLLPYVATVPFDGSDPERSRTWVRDNLPLLKQGQPLELVIGSVRFTLFGNGTTNASLEITTAK